LLRKVSFSEDWMSVLLVRRRSEADFDETFSFIGGKMEVTDQSIIAGLQREKNEEIGETASVRVYTDSTHNVLFRKADGSSVILPHYLAQFRGGDIVLNLAEYSEFRWVHLEDLPSFEPKIENISEMVTWALGIKQSVKLADFVEI